jgi:hypothetical protein
LDTGSNYIWTNTCNINSIMERYKVKKIYAGIFLIATAILTGAMLHSFLNWAGEKEIFDLDDEYEL